MNEAEVTTAVKLFSMLGQRECFITLVPPNNKDKDGYTLYITPFLRCVCNCFSSFLW